MIYSKGISWIDDTRIPFVDEKDMKTTTEAKYTIGEGRQSDMGFGTKKIGNVSKEQGRFTPNLLVCDDALNDGNIVKSSNNWSNKTILQSPYFSDKKQQIQKDTSYGDKGSNSRYYDIDLWFNKMIDGLQ